MQRRPRPAAACDRGAGGRQTLLCVVWYLRFTITTPLVCLTTCPREVILVQLLARVRAVALPVCPCPCSLSEIRSMCAPSGSGPFLERTFDILRRPSAHAADASHACRRGYHYIAAHDIAYGVTPSPLRAIYVYVSVSFFFCRDRCACGFPVMSSAYSAYVRECARRACAPVHVCCVLCALPSVLTQHAAACASPSPLRHPPCTLTLGVASLPPPPPPLYPI